MPGFSASDLLSEYREAEKKIRDALASGSITYREAERMLSDIKARLETAVNDMLPWLTAHTADRGPLLEIASKVLPRFTRLNEALESGILHEIRVGLKSDEDQSIVVRRIQAKFGRAEHNARTLVNTGNAGIANADTMNQALADGFTMFRFMGPSPEREFCREHINQIYSIDEIRLMDNGQRLPVEYFMGGYNCRHHWVPVSGVER